MLAYELGLGCKRLLRNRGQSLLLLVAFGLSLILLTSSFAPFFAIYFEQPNFDPHGQLYVIKQTIREDSRNWQDATYREIVDWETNQDVFSAFAPTILYQTVFITIGDHSERMLGANLTSGALSLVGARPLYGRLFTPEDDEIGHKAEVLLSYRTWKDEFGGNPKVLGEQLMVDSVIGTIVGIMPPDFQFPSNQQLWLSFGYNRGWFTKNGVLFDAVVKLKPGITAQQATTALRQISRRFASQEPASRQGMRPVVMPLKRLYVPDQLKTSTTLLFGLSVLLLILSAVNATIIVLNNVVNRRREFGALMSIGIPRKSLVTQVVLSLNVIIAVAGALAIAVLLLSAQGIDALWLYNAPRWLSAIDREGLVEGSLALMVLFMVGASVVPLVFFSRLDLESLYRESVSGPRVSGRKGWRRGLTVGSTCVLALLSVYAIDIFRDALRIKYRDLGYNPDQVLTLRLGYIEYIHKPERNLINERILEALRGLGNDVSAAIMDNLPVYKDNPNTVACSVDRDGGGAAGTDARLATEFLATDQLFSVLRMPMVEGRGFLRGEPASSSASIVTRSLAAKLWPHGDPVGRTFFIHSVADSRLAPVELSVVGVINDLSIGGEARGVKDAVFRPFATATPLGTSVLIHSSGRRLAVDEVERCITNTERRSVLYFVSSYRGLLARSFSVMSMCATLATVYLAVAGMLGLMGVYTVAMTDSIQRTREFCIRIALGEGRMRLWRKVTQRYLLDAGFGAVLGIAAAAWIAPVIAARFWNVSKPDGWSYVLAFAVVVIIALVSCVPCLLRLLKLDVYKGLNSGV